VICDFELSEGATKILDGDQDPQRGRGASRR